MANAIEHVTIVGGGTSGWLAAALLSGGRNRRNDGPDMRITLVESPSVPTVGVGEATTLSMIDSLGLLALDEKDFIQKCNASLKSAVKFVNWDHDADGRALDYYHPFDAPGYIYGYAPAYHYHRLRRRGRRLRPFAEAMVALPSLLDANKAPRLAEAGDYEGLAPYAYHVDAGLFAAYLREYCEALGVEHIRDDVLDVEIDSRGFVAALALKERGRLPVELVVDCSGFRGLIVRKSLGEPFIDYGDWLPCDRALALQLPHGENAAIAPYTVATGMDAGWSWTVPLWSRKGIGYVYSSRHASDEAALAELRGHVGPAADGIEPRLIRMNIGRSARSWVNNCIAVGLAGGFIEPLESTSIHFVQMSVRWLLDNFPDKACSPPLRDRYNSLVAGLYEEIRDFIVLHYATSRRDDTPFWRAARNELAVPDTLAANLALWRHKLPSTPDTPSRITMFGEWSYIYVLYGKGYFDDVDFPIDDAICDEDFEAYTRALDAERARLMAAAPDHRALLAHIHAAPSEPWYRPEGARAFVPSGPALA